MEILTVLKKMLVDDVNVSAAAIGGIHIFAAPQNSDRPNVVLMLTGGTDDFTQQGPMNFNEDRVRVYSRGNSDRETAELGRKVYNVLQNATALEYDITVKRIFHIFRTGDYDEKAKVFRQIDDYRVFYSLG